MTRTIHVAVLAAFSAILAACGGSSPEGQWALDKEKTRASFETVIREKMEDQGEDDPSGMGEQMVNQMLDAMVEGLNMTVDVRADHTFTATAPMGPGPRTGTWSRDGDKVTFDPEREGEDDMIATFTGDELVFSLPDDDLSGARLYLQRRE